MFRVKLPKFEGPLNLLLELIEEQKLDINELSIARVADDYLEYIRNDENISLMNMADFVNIASKIILIKSRSILPSLEMTPEEEKEIKDLEQQLQLYKKYKEAAQILKILFFRKSIMYSREYFSGLAVNFLPPKKFNVFDLKKQYQKLISQISLPEKMPREAVREIISLEEKIVEIQENLRQKIELSFSKIKNSAKNRVEVIVSFLALLELVKQHLIRVEQKELFSDIKISHNING